MKQKNNTFSILSSSKIWSFKFDHILSTNKHEDSSQEENEDKTEKNKEDEQKDKEGDKQEQENKEEDKEEQEDKKEDKQEQYLDCEVNRFINQNKNLIYINLTDETDKIPSNIPEFPKKFYEK